MATGTLGLRALALIISLACLLGAPVQARTSLTDISASLDAINTQLAGLNNAEPWKVDLEVTLNPGASAATGPNQFYTVPAGQRFHLREATCTFVTASGVLFNRPFYFGISAWRFVESLGRGFFQTAIESEREPNAPTLAKIVATNYRMDTYFEGGQQLRIDLIRRGGLTDGTVDRLTCTISGFMENV